MPKYLYSHLTFPTQENYPLRSALTNKTNVIPSRTKTFKKTFFSYYKNEWNNLNAEVKNAKSIEFFKKMIVTDNKENSVFSVYDPCGVKLLTHLRLQFSHLKEHKFTHGFGATVSPMCACNAEIEDTEHFPFPLDPSFTQLDTKEQVNILLYGYRFDKSR